MIRDLSDSNLAKTEGLESRISLILTLYIYFKTYHLSERIRPNLMLKRADKMIFLSDRIFLQTNPPTKRK